MRRSREGVADNSSFFHVTEISPATGPSLKRTDFQAAFHTPFCYKLSTCFPCEDPPISMRGKPHRKGLPYSRVDERIFARSHGFLSRRFTRSQRSANAKFPRAPQRQQQQPAHRN